MKAPRTLAGTGLALLLMAGMAGAQQTSTTVTTTNRNSTTTTGSSLTVTGPNGQQVPAQRTQSTTTATQYDQHKGHTTVNHVRSTNDTAVNPDGSASSSETHTSSVRRTSHHGKKVEQSKHTESTQSETPPQQ
ncbi:MAG: hypothetical protein V4555_08155 [Acidobacteriota bacterium]